MHKRSGLKSLCPFAGFACVHVFRGTIVDRSIGGTVDIDFANLNVSRFRWGRESAGRAPPEPRSSPAPARRPPELEQQQRLLALGLRGRCVVFRGCEDGSGKQKLILNRVLDLKNYLSRNQQKRLLRTKDACKYLTNACPHEEYNHHKTMSGFSYGANKNAP